MAQRFTVQGIKANVAQPRANLGLTSTNPKLSNL
jgi:hypothetical protein